MLLRLRRGIPLLFVAFLLSAKWGSAQLLFDPASYFVPSRGALSHTLQDVPRLPRILVATSPPPPAPAVPPPPPPPPPAAGDSAASPADSSLSALTPEELLDPSFLVDPGTQVPNVSRHRNHGSTAGSPPPPAESQAAPTPAPEPSAAPTLAPGANSSANGTSPSHLTQIKDLLKPAPPAPPNAAPAAPAPEQALPPQVGSGQPESGRKDSNGTSCEGQGMQGRCNGCICCCAPKGSGGFVRHSPDGCECKKEILTSDIWLTLAMSMLLIVPAAGVGAWFGGLFPVSPHRTS